MGLVTHAAGYLLVTAMFLAAFAPILPDTAPGSDRSIVVAVAGVLLAFVTLINMVQLHQVHISLSENFEDVEEEEEPSVKPKRE